MVAIKLSGTRKTFGSVEVIRGVNLIIEPSEFVVFVGPSGCGKSTLLRLIAGLEDLSAGEIWIDGKNVSDLPPAERGIAMVFQSYALYPHMTVYENMAFGLKLAKSDPGTIDQRVREAAKILKIDHLLDRLPRALSGGQRQRVAIGRAMVRKPKVFLFDEPLSNLDAALRVEMRIEIAKLHHSFPSSMIYVTHDQHEAMTLADRIVVLDAGRVRQFGAPLELYHRPRDRFVAGFIGSPKMNFLPCTLLEGSSQEARLRLPQGQEIVAAVEAKDAVPGEGYSLGIRPEHITLSGEGVTLQSRLVTLERLGAETYLYLDLGQDETFVVKAPATYDAKPDDQVPLHIPSLQTHLFAPNGAALPRSAAALAASGLS